MAGADLRAGHYAGAGAGVSAGAEAGTVNCTGSIRRKEKEALVREPPRQADGDRVIGPPSREGGNPVIILVLRGKNWYNTPNFWVMIIGRTICCTIYRGCLPRWT